VAGPMTTFLLALAAFAANAIRGLTGLGSAVLFVPLASMVWTAAMSLAVSAVLDFVGNAYLCWLNKDTVSIPRSYWNVIGAVTLGILIGSFFITLNDKLVRHLTGSVILLTVVVVILLSRLTLPTLPDKYAIPAGFIVGLISPVSGVPGPAVALMLTLQGKQNEIARLTPPFLLINATVRIVGLAVVGRLDSHILSAAAIMVPFGLAGVFSGQRFGRNIPFHQLRYLILSLVAVSGVWMIAR
jgi:uncharacterized membrane protein YfcA